MTAGSAVAGRARFKVIGRWAKRPRTIDVHIPGLKTTAERAASPNSITGATNVRHGAVSSWWRRYRRRTRRPNGYFTPSKPARPKWLETGEIAFTNEFAAEEDMETGQIVEAM